MTWIPKTGNKPEILGRERHIPGGAFSSDFLLLRIDAGNGTGLLSAQIPDLVAFANPRIFYPAQSFGSPSRYARMTLPKNYEVSAVRGTCASGGIARASNQVALSFIAAIAEKARRAAERGRMQLHLNWHLGGQRIH